MFRHRKTGAKIVFQYFCSNRKRKSAHSPPTHRLITAKKNCLLKLCLPEKEETNNLRVIRFWIIYQVYKTYNFLICFSLVKIETFVHGHTHSHTHHLYPSIAPEENYLFEEKKRKSYLLFIILSIPSISSYRKRKHTVYEMMKLLLISFVRSNSKTKFYLPKRCALYTKMTKRESLKKSFRLLFDNCYLIEN